MSLSVDLTKAIPCTFIRGGKKKIALKVEDRFLWLTQTISRVGGIQTTLVPITEEEKKTINPIIKGTTEEQFKKEGLMGFSLQCAVELVQLIN
mgnify:CR=1 FL=1|jgi:hypothetical protein